MQIRVAWSEERTRISNPPVKGVKGPLEGTISTLVFHAETEAEKAFLHTLYSFALAHISKTNDIPVLPIPFQEVGAKR